MIYLDNAATTLHKPPQVEQAILEALHTAGNPGRGAHEPTFTPHGSCWTPVWRWQNFSMCRTLPASFCRQCDHALNTVLNGVLHPGDHVITTVCEHNSVLRPLYRLRHRG